MNEDNTILTFLTTFGAIITSIFGISFTFNTIKNLKKDSEILQLKINNDIKNTSSNMNCIRTAKETVREVIVSSNTSKNIIKGTFNTLEGLADSGVVKIKDNTDK